YQLVARPAGVDRLHANASPARRRDVVVERAGWLRIHISTAVVVAAREDVRRPIEVGRDAAAEGEIRDRARVTRLAARVAEQLFVGGGRVAIDLCRVRKRQRGVAGDGLEKQAIDDGVVEAAGDAVVFPGR